MNHTETCGLMPWNMQRSFAIKYPKEVLRGNAPFQLWFNRSFDLEKVHGFGCIAYLHLPVLYQVKTSIKPKLKWCVPLQYFFGYSIVKVRCIFHGPSPQLLMQRFIQVGIFQQWTRNCQKSSPVSFSHSILLRRVRKSKLPTTKTLVKLFYVWVDDPLSSCQRASAASSHICSAANFLIQVQAFAHP